MLVSVWAFVKMYKQQIEGARISADAGHPAISSWDHLTFRISKIPENFGLDNLIHVVGRLFQLESKNFTIHSIASDASDGADPYWRTATITFRARPLLLGNQESNVNQWTFHLSPGSNAMSEATSIQFDTHFERFTPLSPAECDDEHRIE